MSAWAKFDSASSSQDEWIVAVPESGTNPWTLYRQDSPTRLVCAGEEKPFTASSSAQIDDTEWHHVACTVNSTDVVVYVDGSVTQVETGTNINVSDGTGGDLVFGSYYVADDRHLDGKIDEVRLYDRALTEGEIEDLYLQGQTGDFNGNYTTSQIETSSSSTSWQKLEVDATIPSGASFETSATAEFRALDATGSIVDSESFNLDSTLKNYTLNVQNSEKAEIVIDGTSNNETKTWQVDKLTAYYKIAGASSGDNTGAKVLIDDQAALN